MTYKEAIDALVNNNAIWTLPETTETELNSIIHHRVVGMCYALSVVFNIEPIGIAGDLYEERYGK